MGTLKQIRETWERDCNVVATFNLQEINGTFVSVIATDPQHNKFRLIRYFPLGNDWHASVDVSDGLPVDVFEMLAHLIN